MHKWYNEIVLKQHWPYRLHASHKTAIQYRPIGGGASLVTPKVHPIWSQEIKVRPESPVVQEMNALCLPSFLWH